jgi:hypothetical protein
MDRKKKSGKVIQLIFLTNVLIREVEGHQKTSAPLGYLF